MRRESAGVPDWTGFWNWGSRAAAGALGLSGYSILWGLNACKMGLSR